MKPPPMELMVTLWPQFEHFRDFSRDRRVTGGIRLNSAMMGPTEVDEQIALMEKARPEVPIFFDVKARQLRVVETNVGVKTHLEIVLNHPIEVDLRQPITVLFKGGNDYALLERVTDGGCRLIFKGGPKYAVTSGESIHLRHPSYRMLGPVFTDVEKEKIVKFRKTGITRWFLSYVEQASDVAGFEELVGHDAEIRLKIESEAGLAFVHHGFMKRDGLSLVAARGDLFVEVGRPKDIIAATRAIIEADPEATVGSRLLLSTIHEEVPSCADLSDLEWLRMIGYRRFMLCDEMCLKRTLLERAVDTFDEFRETYGS